MAKKPARREVKKKKGKKFARHASPKKRRAGVAPAPPKRIPENERLNSVPPVAADPKIAVGTGEVVPAAVQEPAPVAPQPLAPNGPADDPDDRTLGYPEDGDGNPPGTENR